MRRIKLFLRSINKTNLFILICVIILVSLVLNLVNKKKVLSYELDNITSFKISAKNIINLKAYALTYDLDFVELLTYYSLENDFFEEKLSQDLEMENSFIKNYKKLQRKYKKTNYLTYYNYFETILTEIKCFPILLDTDNANSYSFSDSWGEVRNYGGNRIHLGTDIFSKENTRDVIPIISMTDGVIENLGWNEKGGYRVGVRTESGNYYYYAHLSSFSDNIEVGMTIESGTFLGYMGDTGYSEIEGTTGNFPVHLHLGIEVSSPFSEEPIWVNPYPYLSLIEYMNFYGLE